MGYNTTVVFLNDALGDIEYDPDFGKKLADAVLQVQRGKSVDVSAGSHVNAATVIESHHADYYSAVLVGGNYGHRLPGSVGIRHWDKTSEIELAYLRELAHAHGYDLRKKPVRK